MKKILKLVLIAATVFTLCFSMFTLSTLAAGSASVTFSKSNPTVADTVTVTVTVAAPEMYGVNIVGTYNEEVMTYVSGASSGGAGGFQIADSESFNGESSKSFALVFKAKKAGSCTVSVSGQVASGIPPVDTDVAASATLNVKDVTLSSNANLKSLTPSVGSLSPKFSANVTEYTINVKNSVTECKVYVDTVEADAKVAVTGSATLKVGNNTRVVTVTAPSGAQKSYTITIIRSAVEEPKVESNTSSAPVQSGTSSTEDESDTSSTEEVPSALETIIGGTSFVVLKDISSVELPVGFDVTKRLYNNEEITVAIDDKENYELFYLKSAEGDEIVPYTYDENKNKFERVYIITQGSNSYIVAEIPENLTVPEEYISKVVKIQEMNISAYKSEDNVLKDMYYIYCYFGGEYNMYRYDTVENVIQRSPEFELVDAEKQTQVSNIEFVNRFNKLSANAKTIVVCLCVAFVGIVALVVLAIIKLIRNGKFQDFDLDEDIDDFDSVTFDDDFKINKDED